MRPNEWQLTRGGETLAVLRPDGQQLVTDYQAIEGTFETAPEFEAVRPLFEREVELLDADDDASNDEWFEIWNQLRAPGLFVKANGGLEVIEILWIHFKDGRAWWFPLYNSPNTKLEQ